MIPPRVASRDAADAKERVTGETACRSQHGTSPLSRHHTKIVKPIINAGSSIRPADAGACTGGWCTWGFSFLALFPLSRSECGDVSSSVRLRSLTHLLNTYTHSLALSQRCVPVRPCVPCVPCVSRLPPVSFYRYELRNYRTVKDPATSTGDARQAGNSIPRQCGGRRLLLRPCIGAVR